MLKIDEKTQLLEASKVEDKFLNSTTYLDISKTSQKSKTKYIKEDKGNCC